MDSELLYDEFGNYIGPELASDDSLADLIRWALAVQDTALINNMLDPFQRSALHVIILNDPITDIRFIRFDPFAR